MSRTWMASPIARFEMSIENDSGIASGMHETSSVRSRGSITPPSS